MDYPGLPSHVNHDIACKQQKNFFGGVVSFTLKEDSLETGTRLVQSTRLFQLAESLGGVKSLICQPALMTHLSIPAPIRQAAGVKDSLIRISCGIEDTEDLLQDIKHALKQIQCIPA